VLPVRIELTTFPLPRGCSNPERASLGEVRLSAMRRRRLCPRVPRSRHSGQRDTGSLALVERAIILVLAPTSLGLVVGIEEPVLLRLLAEPTGT
jgi:hypothetical protein